MKSWVKPLKEKTGKQRFCNEKVNEVVKKLKSFDVTNEDVKVEELLECAAQLQNVYNTYIKYIK